MEITQRSLEQFVVLAEELHVGRAAERLAMTQPPLSQSLQRLERAVGVRLFDRGPRGLTLTAAGAAYLVDVREQLRMQSAAIGRARRIADGRMGEVHFGFVSGMAYRLVPRLLRTLREQLPDLSVHLHQAPTPMLISYVRSGVVDLAIVRAPVTDGDGLSITQLADDHLAVAVSVDHPLAQRTDVDLAELADERWALPSRLGMGPLAGQALESCQQAGFTPIEHATADTLAGLLAHVAAGGAVSMVPRSVASQPPPGVVVVPLNDGLATMALLTCAISRRDREDPVLTRILAALPTR